MLGDMWWPGTQPLRLKAEAGQQDKQTNNSNATATSHEVEHVYQQACHFDCKPQELSPLLAEWAWITILPIVQSWASRWVFHGWHLCLPDLIRLVKRLPGPPCQQPETLPKTFSLTEAKYTKSLKVPFIPLGYFYFTLKTILQEFSSWLRILNNSNKHEHFKRKYIIKRMNYLSANCS